MQSNTENFLIWGFQKLLQDKEIKKNQNQELKKCCDNLLIELREKIVENGTTSSVLPAVKSDGDNIMSKAKYFEPFELALTSKSQSIVVIALDCLQKLIAYGHISNTACYKDSKDERLIEKIVTYVCECFLNGQACDNVQLQIIKAILTIINNNDLEIHENHLINLVRTCYSIYLACKDPVIQHTAKGTLTQMLNTIFNRMEAKTMELCSQTNNELEILTETLEESECMSDTEKDISLNNSQEIATEIINSIIDNVTNTNCEIKESQTKNFAHIYQKDAFLVFRCLCRLSLKPLPDNNTVPDLKSHDLRSKILSLELLLNILQNSGPIFKQNEIFITAIKQYLCVALSKNGVSSVSEVFELSLSIFLSLLSNFKQHLKRQNEVFFKEIFLYILESPRSSFNHKDLVLEALKRICINAQCVVDIYLNYDCDMTLANIFERLVNDLAKIAQGRQTGDASTNWQTKILRIKALDCLYNILNCMVEWSKELYVNPESQSFFGTEQERHEGIIGSGVAPKPEKMLQKSSLAGLGSMNSINSQSSSQSSLISGPNNSTVLTSQDNPEHFASRKQQKELFEQGISLFNKKPLKGLNFLQSQGLLGTSVADVADFLHKDERLNKTIIGDFLGENDRYNIEVMYAFVDQCDFNGKEFVASLREFLAGFRMPGEAQKIDRLMEKFAARYCECNSTNNVFKSADAAYVLAYSIIILTTDLHSSQIKSRNRMRKEDYIKMNRGINESDDLDMDYLGKIYDEIAGNEIKMKDSSVDRSHTNQQIDNKLTSSSSEKQRQLLFNMEVEEMGKAAKELMESISHIESDFTSATHQEHVKPMFKLVWTPFLAAFSVGLQDCDDSEISRFCLDGIRCAIRIACIFKMELERNAYIQALSRFTLLITGATTSSNGGIKTKNIETIKTLIHVAHSDGNYLGSSWLEILRCISQLESAQLIGENSLPQMITKKVSKFSNNDQRKMSLMNKSDSHPSGLTNRLSNDHSATDHSPLNLTILMSDNQKNYSILQEVMGETGSQSVIVAVDKVFTGSVRLDGDAIVEFVKALCQVSRDELSLPQPRIFSLQKLVEISYYNMGRIRLQWSRVWAIIGEHFTNAGRSPNEDVAIFAMDSLRQLAVKFIEKGEFPNFHFQKDFLRPFVNIIDRTQPQLSRNVEDMVVRCVAQLVQSHWTNIRSGWSNVFLVFLNAASPYYSTSSPVSTNAQNNTKVTQQQETIIEMAFDSLSFVVKEAFKTSFHLVIDSFQMLVKSLAEFACNTNYPDINMEAIRLIRQCARYVDEQGHWFRETTTAGQETTIIPSYVELYSVNISNYESGDDEDKTWIKGWLPVLCELFRVINSCKLDVRTRALTVLFEIVKSYGNRFRGRWWRDTFNLVFKVFDQMPQSNKHNVTLNHVEVPSITSRFGNTNLTSDRSEWLNTTCNHTLYAVVDVFSQYYDALHSILLDDLFAKLKWCCLQDYEQLARSGTSCIETIIISNGQKFQPEAWEKAIQLLIEVFEMTTPKQLLTWKPTPSRERMPSIDSTGSTGMSNSNAGLQQPNSLSENRLQTFASLLVRCVVQFELVQAVNNIVFYPAATRKEDTELWRRATLLAASSAAPSSSISTPGNDIVTTNNNIKSSGTIKYGAEDADSMVDNDVELGSLTMENHIRAQHSESSLSLATDSLDETTLNHWGSDVPKDGLYQYLSPAQLLQLTECLIRSHEFAKQFNCDQEQRNLLWKAGFKGKAKPNLMKQETHSLSMALRILFKLLDDPRLEADPHVKLETVENRLIELTTLSLAYYRTLSTENHRQAWNTILCLLLSKLYDSAAVSDERFLRYVRQLYLPLCDLITIDATNITTSANATTNSASTMNGYSSSLHQMNATATTGATTQCLPLQIRALYRCFLIRFGKTMMQIG